MFTCATDHRFYLDCLRDASRAYDVSIHAYVMMTNHVHFLASPAHPQALPRMMQSLGRRYVGRFNFLYGRTGTLWDGMILPSRKAANVRYAVMSLVSDAGSRRSSAFCATITAPLAKSCSR